MSKGNYRLRLGVSLSYCRENYEDVLKQIESLGFDSVDFDICGLWHKPDEEAVAYKTLEEKINAIRRTKLFLNGVHISFGRQWDISTPDEEKRKQIVEKIKAVFARLDKYEPYCYILHPSFEPIADENRAAHIAALKKSALELCAATKNLICLESLPRTCLFNTSAECVAVIDDLAAKAENIKICADVNHFLQEKSEDAVKAMGERIATTHISDHDYEDERHWMPGKGKINWNELLKNLEESGYQGVFNYEVGGGATPEQIKENYERIFAEYNA